MKNGFRKLIIGGVITVISATAIDWLLTNDRSPMSEYLLWNPGMRNLWGMLKIPSYLAGALAAGNPHDINETAAWIFFILQWMLTGVLITAILGFFFRKTAD